MENETPAELYESSFAALVTLEMCKQSMQEYGLPTKNLNTHIRGVSVELARIKTYVEQHVAQPVRQDNPS